VGGWRDASTHGVAGPSTMQQSRFAIVLKVITAAAVVVLVLYLLLGPYN